MRLLDWIKKAERRPLIASQLKGLTVISLLGVAVFLFAFFTYGKRPDFAALRAIKEIEAFPVAVELEVDSPARGVHFVAPHVTVKELFARQGMRMPSDDRVGNRVISPGMKITVGKRGEVTLGEMAAVKRLALGIPLDVNRATYEDLLLVPGLGEKTASALVNFRQGKGGKIGHLSELLEVAGIKEKRLEKLGRYLTCGDN